MLEVTETALESAPEIEKSSQPKSKTMKVTDASNKAVDESLERHKEAGLFKGHKQDYLEFAMARLAQLEKQVEQLKPATVETDNTDEDNNRKAWFTAISGTTKTERETKLSEIKKALGVEDSDAIVMSRNELYAKAAEMSGKTVQEIIRKGAESEAQAIITSLRKPNDGAGRGRVGSGDAKIEEKFIELVKEIEAGSYKPLKNQLPITAISMKARTNPTTVDNWAKRNNLDFPMPVDIAIEKAKEMEQIAEHGA